MARRSLFDSTYFREFFNHLIELYLVECVSVCATCLDKRKQVVSKQYVELDTSYIVKQVQTNPNLLFQKMTLEECEDFKKQSIMFNDIEKLLVSVLKEAKMQQRITSGMYESARLLCSHPHEVLFCILPQNHLNDVAQHINYMLMEAFCNEHDIPVIKVDCEEKLAQLVVDHSSSSLNGRQITDFSCLLVLTLKDESESEKLMYVHEATGLKSIIELPVP